MQRGDFEMEEYCIYCGDELNVWDYHLGICSDCGKSDHNEYVQEIDYGDE